MFQTIQEGLEAYKKEVLASARKEPRFLQVLGKRARKYHDVGCS